MTVMNRGTGKEPRWHYNFMIRRRRYFGAIPEARTKQQALNVEAMKRLEVFNGTYGKEEPGAGDFGKFVDEVYMNYARAHKSSWRHDEFRSAVLKEYFAGKQFRDITPMLVEKFVRDRLENTTLRKLKRSPSTVRKEVQVLSAIFNMAIDEDVANTNPVRKLRKAVRKKLAVRQKRDRYLTPVEEERLMAALIGRREHLRPLVTLALQTGMRRGELLNLKWEHINLNTSSLFLTIKDEEVEVKPDHLLIAKSKSGKMHTIPLSSVAREALAALSADATATAEYVFTNPGTGMNITDIKRAFSGACRDAQVHKFVFHDLRHTWATRAAASGVDAFTIRDVLGHATVSMSADYTHSTPEARRHAVEAVGRYRETICNKITANGTEGIRLSAVK